LGNSRSNFNPALPMASQPCSKLSTPATNSLLS
jgi:hypothetical protein